MAYLNFPSNPNVGDTYTIGNRTWVWNGQGWQLQSGITSFDPFTANRIVVSTSTNSTSTNSGAIIVNGGAGIGRDLWVGGNIFALTSGTTATFLNLQSTGSTVISGFFTATNFTASQILVTNLTVANELVANISTLTTLKVLTDEVVSGNLNVVGTATLNTVLINTGTFSTLNVTSTTNALNTYTGALKVAGGVGIGADLQVGGNIHAIGNLSIDGNTTLGNSASTVVYVGGKISSNLVPLTPKAFDLGSTSSYWNNVYTNNATVYSNTASNDTASGALVVAGGVGVGGNLYAGAVYDAGSRVVTQANLAQYGVVQITAGTDTAVSTSSGALSIWNTSTLQSITNRGSTTSNIISLTSTASSTGTATGALTVAGGVGVGGYLYASSLYDSSKRVVTEVVPYAGLGISIINTTTVGPQASFTIVNAGVVYAIGGDDISVSTSSGTVTFSNTSTLQTVTSRGSSTNQIISFTNTSDAVSTTTGAVRVAGGLGVGGTVYASNLFVAGSAVITQASIGSYGVSTLVAGTDTVVSSATGLVYIWNTSTIQSVTERGSYTNQIIYFTNTSESTSSVTGAVQISGGLGVNYSGYFGKNLIVGGTNNSISTQTGAFQVVGGIGVGKNAYIDGYVRINSTLNSLGSTSSGALLVAGGVGIGKDLYVGGNIYSSGNTVITSATLGTYFVTTSDIAISINTSTGIVSIDNTSTLQTVTTRGSTTTNAIRIANTFSSTSTYTGQALIVDGGASADIFYAKTMAYVGGAQVLTTLSGITSQFNGGTVYNPINIATGTNAVSTNSGALIVGGGVGIAKDLYVGGNATIYGNLTLFNSATQVTVNSTQTFIVDPIIDIGGAPNDGSLSVNDGFDRGLVLHYSTTSSPSTAWDNHAFLGLDNSTKKLVYKINVYPGGTQSYAPTFANTGSFGDAQFGSLVLSNNTSATSQLTGALQVFGGAGIQGDLYANNIFDNNNRVVTSFNVLAGTGLSGGGTVTGPTGTVALTNTGVLSLTNNPGISLSTTTGNIIIGNTGVLTLYAGTDTAVNTNTGYVTVWNISTLQSVTDRGFTTTNAINILNWTTSTNSSTGALVVSGGAGIGTNLNVGGQAIFWNTTDSIGVNSGAVVINGGLGVGGKIYAGQVYDNGNRVLTAATLGSFGVTYLNAGTDTAISTSTGVVTVWNTSTLQSVTGRGATTTNAVSVNNTLTVYDVLANRLFDNGNRVITNITLNVGPGISGGGTIVGTSSTLAFTNTGVLSLTAGTDTVVSSTSGNIVVWNTSTLQSITNRGATTNNIVSFTNTQTSSSPNTGAVQVTGGVGIGKDLYVGGNINLAGTETITNTAPSTGTNSGALVVNGGVGVGGSIYASAMYDTNARVVTTATISSYAVTNLTAGTDTAVSTSTGAVVVWNTSTLQTITGRGATTTNAINITNVSASTSTNTGALTVAGGVGIGGTLNAAVIATPILTATNATFSNLTVTTIETDQGGLTVQGAVTATGIVYITNTTSAINTVTGALQVYGGVGVQGSVYANGLYDNGNRVLTQSNLGGYGVTTITAGTDTAVSTQTGSVVVWNTSNLQSVTSRGATTNAAISITNGTATTSTYSGSLIVTGGVGISGGIVAGSTVTATNFIANAGTGTTLIQANGTAGSSDSVRMYVANTSGPIIQFGTVALPTTYASIGAYNSYFNIQTVSRDIKLFTQNNTNSVVISATNGNVGIKNNTPAAALDVTGTVNATGNVTFTSLTTATSTNSGALQVAGGVGVGGSLYAAGLYDSGSRVVTNATIGTIAVTSVTAGTDISVTSSTGAVTISDTSTLQSVTNRGATTTNVVYITNTSYNTSTVAGNALQVNGGIGTNYINIVGTGWINGQQIVTTATAGAAVASFNGGTITNPLIINTNTNAVSTTSGALQVAGGAGIGGNLYVGGTTYLAGDLYVDGTQTFVNSTNIITGDKTITLSSATTSSSLASNSGILIGPSTSTFASWLYNGTNAWTTPNSVYITSSTAATSTSSGVLQVAGGVGVGYNLYVSGLGTQATPATISVTGANATTNGDAQIIVGQNAGATDFKILVAGVDARSDGLTANDEYIITGQRLNIYNKGNGTTYNTQLVVGQSGVATYADIVAYTAPASAAAVERLRIDGNTGFVKLQTVLASTGTSSGALIVSGGVGIGQDLFVGGRMQTTGTVASLATNFSQSVIANNSVYGLGGIGGQSLYIANTSTIGGITSITNTTAATSTNTGALQVAGGVGVGGAIYSGAKIYAQGAEVLTTATLGTGGGVGVSSISAGTDTAVSAQTGIVVIWDTSTLQSVTSRGATTNNAITISTTTNSTSTTSGALIVAGGVGIGGNLVLGTGATSRGLADFTHASGNFVNPGDAQSSAYTMRWGGISSTAQVLTADGTAASASNTLALATNSCYTFRILVTAKSITNTDAGGWEFNGVITRGATAALTTLQMVNKVKIWSSNSAWDVNVSADTTNGALQITGTGDGVSNVRFVARIETAEVTN